jgi:hypothetical protein
MSHTIITAGLSIKRPGKEQYSSDGFNLSVELDADVENADQFGAVTRALFVEVKQALEAEVAGAPSSAAGEKSVGLWGVSSGGNGHDGNGGNNGNGRKPVARKDTPTTTPPAERSRSHASPNPISNKQARFLFQLARKGGMNTQADVTSWIAEKLGVPKTVYDLSKVEASKAIDLLNNRNGGNGK